MPQIAVDAQGNKLRWDESKKEWIPVEKAVNGNGVSIEFDGSKWNPVYNTAPQKPTDGQVKLTSKGPEKEAEKPKWYDHYLGLIRPILAGAQSGMASTTGGLVKAADFISGKLGIPKSDAARIIARDLETYAEANRRKGVGGVAGKVAEGLGSAGVAIPEIAILGPLGLPVHGALTGAAEGGTQGAVTGALTGALSHGALKGMSGLSAPGRVTAGAVFGGATTPGGIEDRVAGAATMGGLGLMGGKKQQTVIDKRPPAERVAEEPIGDILGIVAPGTNIRADLPPEVAKVNSIIKRTPSTLQNVASAVKGVIQKPGKVVNKAAFELVDRYDPFRRWDNFIVNSLRKRADEGAAMSPKALDIAEKGIPLDESAYNILQLRGGAGGKTQLAYEDLQKFFRRVADLPEQFTNYLVSLRLIERDQRGISNPGGIKTEDALAAYNKILDGLPENRKKDFRMAARMYTAWANDNILRRLVESNMLSKDDAAKIMEANHHPLPFMKFTSKEDIVRFLNDVSFEKMKDGEAYVNVVGRKIFAMEGMDKNAKISDPWEAVLERLGAVVGVTERNRALVEFVKKSQLSPETRKYVRRMKADSQLPTGMGSFTVMFNGKAQKWSAPLDIIESIKTLEAKDIGFITGLMGKTKNAFVVGTTGLNLPFGLIKNPIRDLWTASVTSKYGFGPGAYLSGLANSLASNFGFPTELYNDYIRSQAGFGQFLNRSPKLKARDLFLEKPVLFGAMSGGNEKLPAAMNKAFIVAKQVLNPISLFKGVSKSIEMAPRMGVFKKSVEGITKQSPELTPEQARVKAALLSRRSTVDFHRAGAFVKTANYFIPFLNARVQSVMNTAEALFSSEGIRSGKSSIFGIKGDPRAIAGARVAAFIVTPALAAYLYNRKYHGEAYDSVPQDTKDRYIVIMTGESSADPDTGIVKPEAILIPKTDAHQIFWNPSESFLDWAWKKKPQDIIKVATNFFSNVSPVQFEKEGKPSLSRAISGVVPPALQAPISIATNRDLYWDRPLVPGRLENVAPAEQYTNYTPKIYKDIGAKLSVSPIKTQKVAESLLGGVARTPSPASIVKGMKETVHRRVGRDVSGDIYDIDKATTSGYETARLRAERLVKDGKASESRAAMAAWNRRAQEYAEKMAKETGKSTSYIKRQEWFKRIFFSHDDMVNTIRRAREKKVSPIKKKLGVK